MIVIELICLVLLIGLCSYFTPWGKLCSPATYIPPQRSGSSDQQTQLGLALRQPQVQVIPREEVVQDLLFMDSIQPLREPPREEVVQDLFFMDSIEPSKDSLSLSYILGCMTTHTFIQDLKYMTDVNLRVLSKEFHSLKPCRILPYEHSLWSRYLQRSFSCKVLDRCMVRNVCFVKILLSGPSRNFFLKMFYRFGSPLSFESSDKRHRVIIYYRLVLPETQAQNLMIFSGSSTSGRPSTLVYNMVPRYQYDPTKDSEDHDLLLNREPRTVSGVYPQGLSYDVHGPVHTGPNRMCRNRRDFLITGFPLLRLLPGI